MTHLFRNRSRLLGGCAGTALALALALSPDRAAAQAIQAEGTVVFGAAEIDQSIASTTVVGVGAATTVIDWQPTEDGAGNALDFLPIGTTALFQNSPGQGQFAVLNRILPSTNGNIAVINGSVISRIFDVNGVSSAGGLIAFYSPTGLLIGSNATFDVGQLLLTTLDVSPADFQNFAEFGGGMTLAATPGSTARVQINPGAQILATPENAFFAVVAADIEMRGTALVNGSHAFVAGEVVNLSFSNGLFNIFVPVGTAASGEVVTVDGTVGGPSSTGNPGDNHMIYGVAHATADPISMMFRGNLGFDPAQSAGIVNGEIILAANHNVFGRFVAGGLISDGIGATFQQTDATSDIRADIFIEDFAASSSLLAIGTHRVQAAAFNTASSVAGNLLLVGRENAEVFADNGQAFTINGDVLVDARDYGVSSSSLQSLDELNAQGGNAVINALAGSTVTVTGNALVTAEAIGGADFFSGFVGNATGGNAQIGGVGGTVSITGSAEVNAAAETTAAFSGLAQVAEARGGLAQLYATQGGTVSVGQNLDVLANAVAAQGSLSSASSVSNAYGGQALIRIFGGGGTLSVGGLAFATASASAGASNNAGAGSIGDAGAAVVLIDGPGLITFSDELRLEAVGQGGENAGGIGGVGLGGRATAATFSGGTIQISGAFNADALGAGGNGLSGGDGLGGIAGAIAEIGQITIGGGAFAGTEGMGGDASFGFGGTGGIGRGGNSAFQAAGSLTQTASVSITGNAFAIAQGIGGRGGDSDGQAIAAGRGGDGYGGQFSVANQADPAFNSGAFILAGGDNGAISVGGEAVANAQGFAGNGGAGIAGFSGGRGGDGFGGLAQVGLALLGSNGSVGQGTATFGTIRAQATGTGGQGGFSGLDFATGDGGNGTGGFAALTVSAGEITANDIELVATAIGGEGTLGGIAQGGDAAILGGLGGILTANQVLVLAQAFGGGSGFELGGDAFGGVAAIEGDGINVTVNGFVQVDASASGGGTDAGVGGNGNGGEAYIATTGAPGSISITGHAQVFANGEGGFTSANFAAGNGAGGLAYVAAQGGGDITLGSTQVTAIGQGGFTFSHEGGDGTGGIVRLLAAGTGSSLTIERNIPQNQTESLGGISMLNANGVGEGTRGGNGIGGTGQGGVLEVIASGGGTMVLPTNIAGDPNSAAPAMFFVARGFGGASEVDGGIGGTGFGGTGLFEVDGAGSDISMGETVFSVYGEGGSSAFFSSNVTGGTGFGGTRRIRVLNGGSATLQLVGGVSGGVGGNGSGTGDGGDAFGGQNIVEVISSTLNIIGDLPIVDQTTGGNGAIGGNAFGDGEGSGLILTATDSTINLLPAVNGLGRIFIGGTTLGGTGDTAGGVARSPNVLVNLTNTTVNGGTIEIAPTAAGGVATALDGIGGNAFSGAIAVNLVDSDASLFGEALISSEAIGGNGGLTGQGGSATSGAVDVTLANSSLTLQTNQVGIPGVLRVQSLAVGGLGNAVGNATSGRATLGLADSAVSASQVLVSSQAFAGGQSGQTGGVATAGEARIALSQSGALNADVIELVGNAVTSAGGNSLAGSASFEIAAGSTATVNADALRVLADGSGADPADLANVSGVFSVFVGGGSVNLGSFEASAQGDVAPANQTASTLAAIGGNLNVTGALSATALGDIVVSTGQGGIIGSPASGGTTTAITIAARGDIIIDDDDSGIVGLGGQSISLAAGGSILLGGSMATENGPISIFANNGTALPLPSGFTSTAEITTTPGISIDAGSGTVTVHMGDGGAVAGRLSGAITLGNISAGRIDVRNFGAGTGSDIVVLGSSALTASGSGRAIDLAALDGEVINLAGDAGLILTGGGHYGIFAATPTGSQIGSFANYARRYNVTDATAYDALNPGGNFAAFRIVPFLTVTADDITRFYGNVTPGLTASFAGFQPGDSIADLLGAPELTTLANATSGVGIYAINLALGTLLSEQGYQFSLGSSPGQLTITPRPITVTANSLSRFYGNANPALTFAVGGLGLVNGDQLTGALATTADGLTGVGSVAITQGTLAASANYALTFVDGVLTITPRPITITADNFSRIYGNANPALTFTLGGLGLVNGDQLTGALATAANATTGVGTAAITQGTLAASANYALTFVNGQLTITPRPITVTANNLSRIYGNANPTLTFTVGGLGLVNGDQLTGALATAANATTGVGTAAITQGTLAASSNYSFSFVGGQLTITPRPITITADSLAKFAGQPDPALTFTVGGEGLVNNDTLSGNLVRDAGEALASFAIRLGTLVAGSNYSITYVGGELTINAPPAPPEVNNPISLEPAVTPGDPLPSAEEEEEARFGMDFPSQPDAPLIEEEVLLDEPVTSGGDPTLYSSGVTPPTGGQ